MFSFTFRFTRCIAFTSPIVFTQIVSCRYFHYVPYLNIWGACRDQKVSPLLFILKEDYCWQVEGAN